LLRFYFATVVCFKAFHSSIHLLRLIWKRERWQQQIFWSVRQCTWSQRT